MFTPAENTHYSRHFTLPGFGRAAQLRLKNARVLYIGAGGLGSAALPYLAAVGVGTIGIIDDDTIEASNLHRQVLYGESDIGKKKVLIAKNKLNDINPFIKIETYDTTLSENNALEIIKQYDIIADGSDNFATRYLVNDACFHAKKPLVYAAIAQFTGQCSVFIANESACYRCLFDTPPPVNAIQNCAEGGVLGVLPGIMGTLQATEVIKLITQIGSPLTNRMLMFDALQMNFRELTFTPNPDCRCCKHQQSFDTLARPTMSTCQMQSPIDFSVTELNQLIQSKKPFTLLDVRELFEREICEIGGIHMPLQSIPERINELDKQQLTIIYCRSGARSMNALRYFEAHGFSNVRNLTGGILAWINEIDPTLTKY